MYVGSYRTKYILELILKLTVNVFIKKRVRAEPWVLTNPTFLFMHHSSRTIFKECGFLSECFFFVPPKNDFEHARGPLNSAYAFFGP